MGWLRPPHLLSFQEIEMNSLSWLIYLADVAESAGGWLSFLSTLAVIILVVGAIAAGLMTHAIADGADEKELVAVRNGILSVVLKAALPIWICLGLLDIVVPSKETIYAIAASELGETALKSDTGNRAVAALNSWLDEQIKPTPTPTPTPSK
jgi:hypothetical protein